MFAIHGTLHSIKLSRSGTHPKLLWLSDNFVVLVEILFFFYVMDERNTKKSGAEPQDNIPGFVCDKTRGLLTEKARGGLRSAFDSNGSDV